MNETIKAYSVKRNITKPGLVYYTAVKSIGTNSIPENLVRHRERLIKRGKNYHFRPHEQQTPTNKSIKNSIAKATADPASFIMAELRRLNGQEKRPAPVLADALEAAKYDACEIKLQKWLQSKAESIQRRYVKKVCADFKLALTALTAVRNCLDDKELASLDKLIADTRAAKVRS